MLVYHERILTNLARKQMRFTEDPSCPFCAEVNEDLDVLFRKCTNVIPVLKYVADNINKEAWANLLFKDWVKWNLKSKRHRDKGPW